MEDKTIKDLMYSTLESDWWKMLDEKAEKGELQKRVYQFPTELEELFTGVEDIEIGSHTLGHIHKGDWYLEMGGPKVEYKSYLALEIVDDPDKVQDGKFTLYGADIAEIPEETSVPFGLHIFAWGQELTPAHTEYLERGGASLGIANQDGWMLVNTRHTIWLRLAKRVIDNFKVDGFSRVAQVVRAIGMTASPLMEKMEIRLTVGTPDEAGKELIVPMRQECMKMWEALDARYMTIEDDDVDVFYGCTICQNVAPNHVCIVTPTRLPYCGILSYTGAKVIYETDPLAYVFPMPKGEELDRALGQYSGVDEMVYEKSNKTVRKVYLNSSILYTSTNCGCFEGVSFYIPEVDGIGLVTRAYFGTIPLGIPFSQLAGMISGGAQNHGFKGISNRGIMSDYFLMGDGGWNRIVWMPAALKTEVADSIPEEVYDKIVTDEDTIDPMEIKKLLVEREHPIIKYFWKDGEPDPIVIPMPGEEWPEEMEKEVIGRYRRQLEMMHQG